MSYPPGPAPPVRVTATLVGSFDVTDWVSAQVPVERRAAAASCSALSCVVTWFSPSRRACSDAWRISMRLRGWRSTAMSESMMEAVSRPEARPLSWMPAIVRAFLRCRLRAGLAHADRLAQRERAQDVAVEIAEAGDDAPAQLGVADLPALLVELLVQRGGGLDLLDDVDGDAGASGAAGSLDLVHLAEARLVVV